MTIFRKKIKSRWLRSFLAYVPSACLTAMTFPAILYSTGSLISGAVGLAAAVLLSFRGRSLVTVAAGSCSAVFIAEFILKYLIA